MVRNNILKALLILPLLFMAGRVNAQVKIGYTTVELILNYMPETKAINQQLEVYEKKLAEKLQIKQKYYQSEAQTYMEKEQSNRWGSPTEKEAKQKELMKLEQEIQGELQAAELDMMKRRNEALGPIQEKMQKAIDEVAKEGGYSYILNNAMGSGIPTMLYGAESADVTEKIAKKLGITIPKAGE